MIRFPRLPEERLRPLGKAGYFNDGIPVNKRPMYLGFGSNKRGQK